MPTEIALRQAPPPAKNNIEITQKNPNSGLRLYPNPTTGAFNAQYYLEESRENTILDVYNSVGQLIYKQPVYGKQGIVELNIGLSQGIYLVVLRDNNKPVVSEKLIVN